jgi:hypothetical protein
MARTVRGASRRKTLSARGQDGAHRLEIAVPAADLRELRKVAALTGETTLTAVLRDALKAYVWMVGEQRRDRRILSEARTGGDRVELMPLLKVSASRRGGGAA